MPNQLLYLEVSLPNDMDPDQTTPYEAVRPGSTLFAYNLNLVQTHLFLKQTTFSGEFSAGTGPSVKTFRVATQYPFQNSLTFH